MWSAALVLGLMMPVGPLAGGPLPPGPPSGAAPVAPPAVGSPAAPRLWVLRAEPQSPAAPYVGVIGDSTGSQLAGALADELRHRDVGVVIATVGGCQPTDVVLTFQSADYRGSHQNCTWEAPAKQREMTIRYHPKVVVWSDVMEWSDIQAEDGRIIAAGTGEWQRRILESWDCWPASATPTWPSSCRAGGRMNDVDGLRTLRGPAA